MEVVDVELLPVLAHGYAFACRADGRHTLSSVWIPTRGLLSFFCNCLECCERRATLEGYPSEYAGMIAVRV